MWKSLAVVEKWTIIFWKQSRLNDTAEIKQVDIPISKNQVLQVLYVHAYKTSWIETYKNLITTKITNPTVQY